MPVEKTLQKQKPQATQTTVAKNKNRHSQQQATTVQTAKSWKETISLKNIETILTLKSLQR